MKIVLLHPNLTQRAGTERVIIDKLNYLADNNGYDITIVTYEHGSHPIAYPISPRIKHIDLNICFHLLYKRHRLFRLCKKILLEKKLQKKYNDIINKIRPDIVITVTYYVECLKVISKCSIPNTRILESHVDKDFLLKNDPTTKKDLITRLRLSYENWGVNHYAKKFDLLIALTEQDANNWSKTLNTTIITNMVHLRNDGIRSKLNNKHVIFAGRYSMEKGIFELFEIWKKVYQKHPDWQLDLYGEGSLRNTLVTKAKELNANINVNESTDNIFEKYQESSVFVLCSVFEAFGLVIPEAMSCGLPVVSFDCPFGPRHIITNGIDGFLIPNRDIQLFADRVCELIESEEMRIRIGQAAILTAKKYSAEQIIPKWIELYENLCSKKITV